MSQFHILILDGEIEVENSDKSLYKGSTLYFHLLFNRCLMDKDPIELPQMQNQSLESADGKNES